MSENPAYDRLVSADQAFQRELERTFGRDACNRRYDVDRSDWPDALKNLSDEYQIAANRWRATL